MIASVALTDYTDVKDVETEPALYHSDSSTTSDLFIDDCLTYTYDPQPIASKTTSLTKNISRNRDGPSDTNVNKTSKLNVSSDSPTANEPTNYSSTYRAAHLSLIANIILFLAKCMVFYLTYSLAVIASLVDSALDLVSQIILFCTERSVSRPNADKYPVGKTRLEPVGILIVSILMVMTSVTVVREAIAILVQDVRFIQFSTIGTSLMSGVIVIKFALWIYCRRIKVPVTDALAQDHINDVCSNSIALVAAVLAAEFDNGWSWIDPVGAIIISIYIIYSWYELGRDEIRKLVGKVADDELLEELRQICDEHCADADLDVLIGYHIGRNILVEVEMIMDSETPLRVSHDVCIDLQQKLEKYEYVERAFVHCDYKYRGYNEHKLPMLA